MIIVAALKNKRQLFKETTPQSSLQTIVDNLLILYIIKDNKIVDSKLRLF